MGDTPDKLIVTIKEPHIFRASDGIDSDGIENVRYLEVVEPFVATVGKQMRSEEEYNQMVEQVESATQTTWWLLGVFASTKLLGFVRMDPIFSLISFAQLEIFFKNF